MFVVNEDTSDWIRIDRITVDVVVDASADLTGTLVPSALEGEIVAGGETLIITLTNDTWDLTVGADNAITTALINGIDSALSGATGCSGVCGRYRLQRVLTRGDQVLTTEVTWLGSWVSDNSDFISSIQRDGTYAISVTEEQPSSPVEAGECELHRGQSSLSTTDFR